jgi:hypothetical protein
LTAVANFDRLIAIGSDPMLRGPALPRAKKKNACRCFTEQARVPFDLNSNDRAFTLRVKGPE